MPHVGEAMSKNDEPREVPWKDAENALDRKTSEINRLLDEKQNLRSEYAQIRQERDNPLTHQDVFWKQIKSQGDVIKRVKKKAVAGERSSNIFDPKLEQSTSEMKNYGKLLILVS